MSVTMNNHSVCDNFNRQLRKLHKSPREKTSCPRNYTVYGESSDIIITL